MIDKDKNGMNAKRLQFYTIIFLPILIIVPHAMHAKKNKEVVAAPALPPLPTIDVSATTKIYSDQSLKNSTTPVPSKKEEKKKSSLILKTAICLTLLTT